MKREIRFRAWIHSTMEYIDDLYWFEENMVRTGADAELMQYTGLHDKNGKEIYEGDICQREDVLYEIRWVDGCAKWGAKVIKSQHVLTRECTFPLQDYVVGRTLQCSFKVIGNIYENPDLLQ